jgi:sulfhydrogenase subunit alpha
MSKIIKIDHLTKIEGHAHLTIKIDDGKLKECSLGSIEGSRYFEGIVKGRQPKEAPEITSRICGICSNAHTLCASMAIENALNIKVSEQTIKLRNLLNWGERIRSHATHLYFMSLPDFLGFESALTMLPKNKDKMQVGLNLMKTGNGLMNLIGGRDLHPVSAQVGGFLKLPEQKQLEELRTKLEASKKDAIACIELFQSLEYPKFENKRPSFTIYNKDEYGMLIGDIKADKLYKVNNYQNYLKEYHESDSTANFVVKDGKSYKVGALARINNNKDQLNPLAKKYSKDFPTENIFYNNLAQAIEILHGIEDCIKILKNLKIKPEKPKTSNLTEGHGIDAIEVPRGILFHEYKIKDNKITYCNIITPTAQNLRSIEEDIQKLVSGMLNEEKDKIVHEVEKLIRAYDPCFSCSSHFLDVTWL